MLIQSQRSQSTFICCFIETADSANSNYSSYAEAAIKDQTDTKDYDYTMATSSLRTNQAQEGESITLLLQEVVAGQHLQYTLVQMRHQLQKMITPPSNFFPLIFRLVKRKP